MGSKSKCRICLVTNVMLINIHTFSVDMGSVIAEGMLKCLPVQISKGDGLPGFVCNMCYYKLLMFMEFQEQAVRSEETMQGVLEKTGLKAVVIDSESDSTEEKNESKVSTVKKSAIKRNSSSEMVNNIPKSKIKRTVKSKIKRTVKSKIKRTVKSKNRKRKDDETTRSETSSRNSNRTESEASGSESSVSDKSDYPNSKKPPESKDVKSEESATSDSESEIEIINLSDEETR